jgi:hypothetical protein
VNTEQIEEGVARLADAYRVITEGTSTADAA